MGPPRGAAPVVRLDAVGLERDGLQDRGWRGDHGSGGFVVRVDPKAHHSGGAVAGAAGPGGAAPRGGGGGGAGGPGGARRGGGPPPRRAPRSRFRRSHTSFRIASRTDRI